MRTGQDEFERCLSSNRDFSAAFSFERTFEEAPNPALRLENLGVIGLPLSERDADAIKAHAKLAPFGMGERTIVKKSVRDTWEMDAQLVLHSRFICLASIR